MKLSGGLALLLASTIPTVASESDSSSSLTSVITKLPTCAAKCFGGALTQTKCSLTDQKCICSDQVLLETATACIMKSCTAKEALTVKKLTSEGCNAPIRDKNAAYIRVSDVLGVISGLFIFQRFAFKLWAKQTFWWDDWFALATVICGSPSTVINAYGVGVNGIGQDAWTLSFDQLYNFGKFFYIMEVLYFFEIAMVKLSLLLFFLRIFPAPAVRRLLWGTAAFTVVYGIVFVFVGIFTCSPISYFWTKWDQEHSGKCMDINVIAWSNAGIGIAIDVWMLAIPMWQLKGLKMHWKKKISVAAMFMLGTFVTVVSILRLRSLVKFGTDSLNPTWDFFEVGLWSTIEVNVGIWCVCLPSFRLLLVRLFPTLGGSTARSYAGYDSSNNRPSEKNNRSAGLGPSATATSGFNEWQNRSSPVGNQIAYHKSYAVEVSDLDEVALMTLKDHESRTAASSSRGSA
ncbi:CFEM domain-containing protein, partial [Metarhizium majus ARSEF 297]